MSSAILIMSLFLVGDATWFDSVCFWCLICLALMYLETSFGICVGCKIYDLGVHVGLFAKPVIKPNCMGDACDIP
jgi:hypothetical protein